MPHQRQRHRSTSQSGFTLLELSVVVFLIGVVAAIVVPRLIPIISFSELEGSARRLAAYGKGAMAHAAMLREKVVVRVDLKKQEIYAVHWIYPEKDKDKKDNANDQKKEPDQLAMLAKLKGMGIRSGADLDKKLMKSGSLKSILSDGTNNGQFNLEEAGYQMDDKFNQFTRQALEARAKNVKHDDDLLAGVGDIYSDAKPFTLDKDEPVEEELAGPILRRMHLRGDVRITGMDIDGKHVSRGVPEIEFSVLGLAQRVVFYIENDDGDTYTVLWDPVMEQTKFVQGVEPDL